MAPLYVVLPTVLICVLVVGVLWLVFAAVRRAIDRAALALASEGVELDSGQVTMTTRMRQFRSETIYSGGGIRRTPGRVVLTKQRLHIIGRPQRYGIFDRAELSRFTVGVLDGKLHLHSSDPPRASGSIDYRIPVNDPTTWVDALAAAGAQRASESAAS